MEFLSLSRSFSFARNVPSGEERGETDVFAGLAACRWIYLIGNILWPPEELTAARIAQRDKRRSVK